MSGGETPALAEISSHVREHLAAYKAPRDLVLAQIVRAPNGKLDYKAIREQALQRLAPA